MEVYVKGLGHALLVAYVDDVLLASENEKVQKAVEEAIGKVVPVKVTGSIQTADNGGGSLTYHWSDNLKSSRSFPGDVECQR